MTTRPFEKRDAAGLLAALVFVALAFLASRGQPLVLDPAARALARRMRSPGLEPVMFGFAVVGTGYTLLALAALAYLLLRSRGDPRARRIPTVALGALAFEQIAKWLVARPRPDETSFGFPSGHVFGATVFFGLLAWWAWNARPRRGLRWVVAVLAILAVTGIAACRLYFDVHWLSDVGGGLAGGVAYVRWVVRRADGGERASAEVSDTQVRT
jgi:membrane-associated phospholipid phosphatase